MELLLEGFVENSVVEFLQWEWLESSMCYVSISWNIKEYHGTSWNIKEYHGLFQIREWLEYLMDTGFFNLETSVLDWKTYEKSKIHKI